MVIRRAVADENGGSPEGRGQPVRMKDVARDLGMSVATVSRALSNPDMVVAAKRERIEEAIARLNYRPNLIARTLRRRESRTALIVFPDLSPFFLDVFLGAERAAGELGYTALMGHCGRDPRREQLFLDQALSGRADGVILVTSSDNTLLAGRSAFPPLVAMMERIDGCDFPTVRVDNHDGARVATKHLIGLGHRRIAHIAGPAMAMARHRTAGFRSAIEEAGLDPRHCYVIAGEFSIRSGEAAMERLLTRHPRPTAVFAANDEMAVGALQAIKRAGLRIGVDISVIGFDDQRMAQLYEPKLTTVHVPMEELGYRAMRLLRRTIGGMEESEDVILPTRLVIRETTGAPHDAREQTPA